MTTANPADTRQLDLLAPETAATDAPVRWSVRTSARARTMRIQVYPHGGVEVIVPRSAKSAAVRTFVAEHMGWIESTRERFREQYGEPELLPQSIHLAAVDQQLAVSYVSDRTDRVRELPGSLLVCSTHGDTGVRWRLLRDWLKRRSAAYLRREVRRIAVETGLQPARVQVRIQRTRWGSCSGTGTVSLNAALLLRTPEEVRYVLVHELCHLRHMNHSRRFWQLVEQFVPDYRTLDARLDHAWERAPLWLIGE